jgi:hypothetical protein
VGGVVYAGSMAWGVVADVGFHLVFLPVGEAQCLGVDGEVAGGGRVGGVWGRAGEEGRRVDLEEGADGADVGLGDEVDVVVEDVWSPWPGAP